MEALKSLARTPRISVYGEGRAEPRTWARPQASQAVGAIGLAAGARFELVATKSYQGRFVQFMQRSFY